MTLSAPAVTYGANGIVTVTVSSASGTPTGGVSLSVDGGAATTQGLIIGSTTFTITSPSIGSHTLNATYAAQGNFGASSSSGTLIVNLAPTTTTITAPAVTFGANGIVTVTVSSAAGTPSGSVSLSVDGGAATPGSLNSGSATFMIPSPSAGTHALNAAYAAQGNFGQSSASGSLGVGVGATTLTISAPTVTYGANGIVTVTVSSTATPTGNVQLSVDGGAATTRPLTSGSTAFTITTPSAGSHTLNAAYAAQGNFGASSASSTLTVNKATATVTLGSLSQTYDGTQQPATATTNPAGLTVNFTYDGSGTAPTNAGSYTVVGTINNTNYQGSATGTLVIAKAAATVTLGSLSQTYDGTQQSATATTNPAGLTVNFTYDGSGTAPTNAGSYTVVGTINNTNYQGSATGTLVIAKAAATVTLGSLSQTYDGTQQSATATTNPAGLTVNFTYDGSGTAPTNAGSYAVVGTINNSNYQGNATGTLVIGKATATVTLGSLSQTFDGSPKSATATTTPPGLTVNFTYDGSPTAPTNVGSYTVVGTINNLNYQGSATGTLVINP